MSRRSFVLIAVLLCAALSVAPLFAGGQGEKGAATVAGKALLPWTGDPVVYKGFGADLSAEKPDMPVAQEYRKTTGNVSIKWEKAPWADFDTKVNLYLASGDIPDIMWVRDSVPKATLYGPNGLFLDFNKYKEYMPNVQNWVKQYPYLNLALTDKGERFTINDVITADYVGEGWYYNPTVLAKAGISAPPKTLDEMYQDMKQVKAADPTADGYIGVWGLGYAISTFGNVMNAAWDMAVDKTTNKWIYGPSMDPKFKTLIEFLHKLYAEKLLNPGVYDSTPSVTDKVQQQIYDGNYAFHYGYYFWTDGWWGSKGLPVPLKGMKPPSYNGKTYYQVTVPADNVPVWGFVVNAKVKNPALMASYIDNIMSVKTYELQEWGIEGQTYTRTADGGYAYLPEFVADPSKLAPLGVGNLDDPRYIHYNDYKSLWFGKLLAKVGDPGRAQCAVDIKAIKAGEYIDDSVQPRPFMTAEQNDEISKIMTPVKTFVEEQRLKFITGDRPMSEWDSFISQLKGMGDIDKVVAYYNAGRQFRLAANRSQFMPNLPPDLK